MASPQGVFQATWLRHIVLLRGPLVKGHKHIPTLAARLWCIVHQSRFSTQHMRPSASEMTPDDTTDENVPENAVPRNHPSASVDQCKKFSRLAISNLIPNAERKVNWGSSHHPIGEDGPVVAFHHHIALDSATCGITAQCLRVFSQSLDALSNERRDYSIKNSDMGRSVLNWLSHSRPRFSEAYDLPVVHRMVKLLIAEGHERLIWKTISENASYPKIGPFDLGRRDWNKWRRQIARALVSEKIDFENNNLDESLKTYFGLLETQLRRSEFGSRAREGILALMDPPSKYKSNALKSTTNFLLSALADRGLPFKGPVSHFSQTDPALWNRFYDGLPDVTSRWRLYQALMKMYPVAGKMSDPFPYLTLLQDIDDGREAERNLFESGRRRGVYRAAHACASQLKAAGHHEESSWVLSMASKISTPGQRTKGLIPLGTPEDIGSSSGHRARLTSGTD